MRAVSNQVWATEEERPFSFGLSSFWPKLEIWPGVGGASEGRGKKVGWAEQFFRAA